MIRTLFIFLTLTGSVLFSISSCNKDPEIREKIVIKKITDTITQNDTIVVRDTIQIIETIKETILDTATTFILLRHAETSGSSSDPHLSTQGMNRAQELSNILSTTDISAIYTTLYNRTQETVRPTANDKNLNLNYYDPNKLNAFVDKKLEDHKQETILIVGHSNTTPNLLNIITGTNQYANIPENEYDNLYIVNVLEKGRAQVIHLKYGQ